MGERNQPERGGLALGADASTMMWTQCGNRQRLAFHFRLQVPSALVTTKWDFAVPS